MNKKAIKLATGLMALALFSAVTGTAQKPLKTWTEWSQKDAQKILDDSPWGRTQSLTDTSEMFFSPTADPRVSRNTSTDASRTSQGATNQAVNVNFRIRFFSARPIRQAFVRLMMINQSDLDGPTKERMSSFANLRTNEWIIIAVTFDSRDQRYSGPVMQAFNSATTDTLKNDTYLERKDGKRLFLNEYVPPGKDGFGAKFIFPRMVDGQPFLTAESGEVRFQAQYNKGPKVDMRFKITDMMYEGQLEY